MTKDDIYYDLFTELRGMGLTKMFEEYSVRFFMGIATTQCAPVSKDVIVSKLKDRPDSEIPEEYIKFIDSVLKDTDRVRYHPICLPHMSIHYLIILNDDLEGRLEDLPNVSAAFSKMCVNIVPKEQEISSEEGETSVPEDYYDVFAIIMVGDKSPQISDTTRGPIIKHELTHILIKYLVDVEHPDLFNIYKDDLTKEELDSFIEFLCDFIQCDSSVINKFTVNPINKFVDTMEILFKPETVEQYAPYLKSISRFYNLRGEEPK